ncbi:hypothetical protein GCWU000324_00939 [Kingella oralis ATCC 51147]|uniref:Uncharacterized protein n=1 Tax=Kingella oralis ATCC 51147 TaxID=629741 RepID=C4GFM3_9NEIS|nr:hypothetical protein GCWU000324_00939 [Kingella oralis ATCC 51147]
MLRNWVYNVFRLPKPLLDCLNRAQKREIIEMMGLINKANGVFRLPKIRFAGKTVIIVAFIFRLPENTERPLCSTSPYTKKTATPAAPR